MEDNALQNENNQAEEQPTNKTYSQEEVNELIQKEADKRVSAAMATAERKANARIKEAEKLAKMNEEQRYQYELETREKAIAEKERALALAENKAEASTILSDKGISAKLVELVVAEDADTMLLNINLLEQEFKASVKAEVERRLSTSTPRKNLPTETQVTKEAFKKMSLKERAELYANQPALYEQLSH
jgi:hypothetical protein